MDNSSTLLLGASAGVLCIAGSYLIYNMGGVIRLVYIYVEREIKYEGVKNEDQKKDWIATDCVLFN